MNGDLLDIIRAAAQMGAAAALGRMQPKGDRISKAKAAKLYGRKFLDRNAARLTVTANGNRLEYSLAELEQVKAAHSVAELSVKIQEAMTQPTLKS